MISIDLNSDLGESFGAYTIGNDEEVLKYISSANIACGFHAGDHNVMMKTVRLACSLGVGIGAHPGFPDLAGFGRRNMQLSPEEIFNLVVYQVGAIQGAAKANDAKVQHVKPHGALYNIASVNRDIAGAVARAVRAVDPQLVLFGLAGSELVQAGEEMGLKVAREVFADRTYQPDGTLTPRSQQNAVIHDADEAVLRVLKMVKEGKVMAVNGQDIFIQADTICVHGDEEKALEFVKKLRTALLGEKIEIRSFGVGSHD
ncbi:5-oxoprolinase subunit PxpA [Mesobacillus foraminis]|uniref:LamB/YcsF family protein n=1 Tax=Mesobacillus foraminis TaxID=279826 RepID=UPI001BEA77AE|nr:5-oxoprolinase subunit PxpA [Mesobacillus foraminis]MBT2757026.1 5-oxoprolinase subunit PxpA [Mesobacillus foraminis]